MSKRIFLSPKAGFVVKTTNQIPGVYSPTTLPDPNTAATASATNRLDGPRMQQTPVDVGFKIFLNIAYDDGVPPPPKASESDIRKAMAGDENSYFVPVVVSDGREATDKAGKVSLVFDTVFHTSIRERASKDPDYKTFIIEIALERVEEKSGLTLGREIGTPNIKSKGPLPERSVLVPASWSPSPSSPTTLTSTSGSKPLIEEVTTSSKPSADPKAPTVKKGEVKFVAPKWVLEIEKTDNARMARIEIEVPLMTRDSYPKTTLDLEQNRLLFSSPHYSTLDTPLFPPSSKNTKPMLGVNIDEVVAEWRVKEGKMIILAPIVTLP